MNAAFLLMTTAWLAGVDGPAPGPAAAAPAPAPAPYHGSYGSCSSCGTCGSCGSSCSDCCEKESWFGRLRNRMRHSKGDDCCQSSCQTTCCQPAPSCCTTSCSSCGDSCCEKESWWGRMRGRFHKHGGCDSCDSCAAPSCCQSTCTSCGSSCDCGESKGLFNRMRGWFGGRHGSCDSCGSCGSCSSYGSCGSCCGGDGYHHGVQTMPPVGEKIPAPTTPPKKMPDGGKKTSLIPQTIPAEPIAAPATPPAPGSPRPLDLGHSPY